jgi:LPS O-antigen subunit length determinant protein (WzzB/FepE family)
MILLWLAESSGGFVFQLAALNYVFLLQNNWKANFLLFNIETFMVDYIYNLIIIDMTEKIDFFIV